jgi:hypothetical protein
MDMEGNETIAVNARCLEGVDTDTLTKKKVNGKNY